MRHKDLVGAALAQLSASKPASVRAICQAAERAGLTTTDRRGVGHRVRTVLQALKSDGYARHAGPDQWSSSGTVRPSRRVGRPNRVEAVAPLPAHGAEDPPRVLFPFLASALRRAVVGR